MYSQLSNLDMPYVIGRRVHVTVDRPGNKLHNKILRGSVEGTSDTTGSGENLIIVKLDPRSQDELWEAGWPTIQSCIVVPIDWARG